MTSTQDSIAIHTLQRQVADLQGERDEARAIARELARIARQALEQADAAIKELFPAISDTREILVPAAFDTVKALAAFDALPWAKEDKA